MLQGNVENDAEDSANGCDTWSDYPYGLPPWKKSRSDQRLEEETGTSFHERLHTFHESLEPQTLPCVTLTMDGAGVLGAFHNGVARYLEEHLQIDSPKLKFCGTSSGAAVAAALVSGVDMNHYFFYAKRALREVRLNLIRPDIVILLAIHASYIPTLPCPQTFSNPFRLCSSVRKCLEATLPTKEFEKELLQRVNGRYFPSLSIRVACCGCQPEPVTEFESREEFIGVVRASCHLPLIGGVRGYFVRGRRYYDGGLSQKFALFPAELSGSQGNIVIRITPWASIKPGWIASGLRFSRGWTYKPRDDKTMNMLFRLGYYRAKEFFVKLKEENTIDVLQHVIRNEDTDSVDYVDECVEELISWFKKRWPSISGNPEHYQRWNEWVLHPTNWRKPQWGSMAAVRNLRLNLRNGRRPRRRDMDQTSSANDDWTF